MPNGDTWYRKKIKSIIVLVALAASLTLAGSLHVYYLTDFNGGTLFWKGEEAYLFLGTGHLGYRISYLKYPFVVIGQYFYVPAYTDDVSDSSVVIRITPSTVERHAVDYGYGWDIHVPAFLTPFDDGIYAMCQGAILCKWTGNAFEPATEEERHRLDGINRLIRADMNNQAVNGWHVRTTGTIGPGGHLEIPLGEGGTISVDNLGTNRPLEQWIVIKLLRPNQPPETLYDVNGNQRRVGKKEYESAIRRR